MEDKIRTSGHTEPECGPAAKKAKRSCKWQPEWKLYHMAESKKGASYVICNIYGSDFSVASGSIHDVKRHAECKKHSELARGMTSQSTFAATFENNSLTERPSYEG